MGCGASVPDPSRPETHPFDASAIALTLVKKGSMNELRLASSGELKMGAQAKLELASHPGWGIVAKTPEKGPYNVGRDRWLVIELGVGKADGPAIIRATFDTAGFITSCHAANNGGETPSMVFDVAWWKYEDGNNVNLIGEAKRNEKSRYAGGGRTFVVNADGSVSPAMAPHLALGFQLPDCTLVSVTSPNKVTLADPGSLRGGGEAPLYLSSHPGYAICSKVHVLRPSRRARAPTYLYPYTLTPTRPRSSTRGASTSGVSPTRAGASALRSSQPPRASTVNSSAPPILRRATSSSTCPSTSVSRAAMATRWPSSTSTATSRTVNARTRRGVSRSTPTARSRQRNRRTSRSASVRAPA